VNFLAAATTELREATSSSRNSMGADGTAALMDSMAVLALVAFRAQR
jgi:hypothetical protein